LIWLVVVPGELFEEALGGAFGFGGVEFGGWGEWAEEGVVDDFGDGFFGG
jgi:hypothetical protein